MSSGGNRGDERLRLAVAIAHEAGRQAAAARGGSLVACKGMASSPKRECTPTSAIGSSYGSSIPSTGPTTSRSAFRASLHLAYAAIGALDIVLDHKAALWDVAAGAVILREAGGTITDPCGQPLFPAAAAAYCDAPMPLLAGNRTAHAQALADCRLDARPAEAP